MASRRRAVAIGDMGRRVVLTDAGSNESRAAARTRRNAAEWDGAEERYADRQPHGKRGRNAHENKENNRSVSANRRELLQIADARS